MTAAIKPVPTDRPSFIEDYLRAGWTVEPMGRFYTMFDLRVEANNIEDHGCRAVIKFGRDTTGKIDGVELARLRPRLTIETNAADAGAAVGETAGSLGERIPPAPQPSHTTLAIIDHVREEGMMTDPALAAPVESICEKCYGAGGYDSDDRWPTAPAWLVCTGCGGEGVKP